MILHLVRHPEAEVPDGTCYGSTDLPLKAGWEELVPGIAELLPAGTIAYASPLRRCAEFAAALFDSFIIEPRLRELDLGSWEMSLWHTIGSDLIEAWARDLLHSTPHGGESFAELWRRVSELLYELRSGKSENIALVGHAGPLRVLLMQCLQIPAQAYPVFAWDFGALSAIELNGPDARLLFHNRCVRPSGSSPWSSS